MNIFLKQTPLTPLDKCIFVVFSARTVVVRQCHRLPICFLASQDALEVIVSLSQSVTLRTKLTDVILVSEDIYLLKTLLRDSDN